MQIPILIGWEEENGKFYPVHYKHEVCAKTNKLAQEVFRISGFDGEIPQLVEVIYCDDEEIGFRANTSELWVLGSVLIMN